MSRKSPLVVLSVAAAAFALLATMSWQRRTTLRRAYRDTAGAFSPTSGNYGNAQPGGSADPKSVAPAAKIPAEAAPSGSALGPNEALAVGAGPERAGASEIPYAGIEACRACHEDRVDEYAQTSHANSFSSAAAGVPGDFRPGHNELRTRLPDLRYELTAGDDGYYQTSIEEFPLSTRRHTERIDLVMGSGKYAHAYMYWVGGRLYQMPVAFFTPLGIWVNPPGYSDRWAWWDRPMTPRCLECHATYFEHVAGSENAYVRGREILAIGCERCHGPARRHIAFHQSHPEADTGAEIVAPAELSRQRQLEICGQCHGTVGRRLKPAFSYRPGKPLSEYLAPDDDPHSKALVHAVNQVQRLGQSKCFQHSEMTCTTCHDPHHHERGQTMQFSQRCLDCHTVDTCPTHRVLGDSIQVNCIDCHMPRRNDESLPFNLPGRDKLKLIEMREHRIAVYPEDAHNVIENWPRIGGAAVLLDEARRQRLDQASEAIRRAGLWLAIGQSDEAVACLDAAAATDDPRLLSLLGSLLVAQGNFQRALIPLRRSLQIEPDRSDTLFHLAVAYDALGRDVEAADYYCDALRLEPTQSEAKQNLAWILATAADATARDGTRAVDIAEQLVRQSPDSWLAHSVLAAAYAEVGNFLQAVRTVRRAIELCRRADSPDQLASLEQQLRHYERREPLRLPNYGLPGESSSE